MHLLIASATDLDYKEAKIKYSAKSGRIHCQTKLQNAENIRNAMEFTRHKTYESAQLYNRPDV